ncbi:MAG TPA: DUF3368 domain-containing protein [Chitinophagales bacterium]|nr:DUF3368 domain-containing protein [Chitinophagales bacterium]
MIIIADSSCLIALSNIQQLSLLEQVFGELSVTREVASEFGLALPDWISVEPINNNSLFEEIKSFLDEGEASSIVLAIEHPGSLLIIDEIDGRKAAQKYSVQITGTIGIIGLAKQKKIIAFVKPLIDNLKQAGFRLSEELETNFLKQNNEL